MVLMSLCLSVLPRCDHRSVSTNRRAARSTGQEVTLRLREDEVEWRADRSGETVQMTQSKYVDIAGWTVDWQLNTSVLAAAARRRCPLIIRPAMLLRRKVCAAVVIAAILFLMLASQSIQRRHFLPLSLALPIIRATPSSRETGEALMSSSLGEIISETERVTKLSSVFVVVVVAIETVAVIVLAVAAVVVVMQLG